jgi:3-phosphoshikimate 1-carboxyvinyltransferase
MSLPGSKSLTNRALVLAALSGSDSQITGGLDARDSALMRTALRGLGIGITETGDRWTIRPGRLRPCTVDCGLAGTVMRFLPPLAALADGDSTFDGDPVARTRPMGALLSGLRQAGVRVSAGDTLPATVHGTGSVRGGEVAIDASASSQFVSALLLAGARFDRGLDIRHTGSSVPSATHIEMSLAALRECGVDAEACGAGHWRVAPGEIKAPDVTIEPDLSNAAPFLAAAGAVGGSVTIRLWPQRTTQAGDALRSLLCDMGAEVRHTEEGLRVAGDGHLRPLVTDLHDVGELTPVLAALCALAEGESRISGVAHIRGHETDRLAALRIELTGLGSDVTETDDGLIIRPASLHGGRWHSYADHRMAQAGAVLGLVVPGVVIDDIDCTAKTLSDFPGLWSRLLVGADPLDRL